MIGVLIILGFNVRADNSAKKIIEDEKSKLSDQDIALLLNKKGYSLARRTISKYRLKLNIPYI